MPNPREVAQLAVGGTVFEDWESVYVQHRWQEGWPTFRFTAAEGGNLPLDWAKLQFKPGDPCTIILGGQLAVTGIITQRQVAYAGSEHGVQLSGVGKSWASSTSSVNTDNNGSTFDNMPLLAAAQKAVTGVKGTILPVGTINSIPFERLQSQPGELVFDFLDKIARMRMATLGSDHLGNLLLIGEHSKPIVQELWEGKNILKMQCVFSIELMYGLYKLNGQHAVAEQKSMRAMAEINAKYNAKMPGFFRSLEIPTEQPLETNTLAQMRLTYEALQRDGTQVKANVTVQGWLRDGGALWMTGDNVIIHSPMCPLSLAMKIQTATFTQDNKGGTITLLECVLPWMLGDKLYQLGQPKQGEAPPPQPPEQATSSA